MADEEDTAVNHQRVQHKWLIFSSLPKVDFGGFSTGMFPMRALQNHIIFSLLPIFSRFTMEQKSGLCLNTNFINIHELSTKNRRLGRQFVAGNDDNNNVASVDESLGLPKLA